MAGLSVHGQAQMKHRVGSTLARAAPWAMNAQNAKNDLDLIS